MLEHGGNLRTATAQFGEQDWIDLSAGLNPHWYPVPAVDGNAWHRLPEPDPALEQAACAYYGAPRMLAVAGTQAAIQALPQLRGPSRVVVSSPSYAEHAQHWRQHGHSMAEVLYDRLEAALPGCDVMVVCNPNNPTGATVAPDRLLTWAGALAARGGWLVVDEAFGDVTPALSVAGACGRPGLVVLRSLGKFFGLAGVRVGFVAGPDTLLDSLADALGPWTVSGPAQSIGKAALLDRAWQEAQRASLAAQGARLSTLLAAHNITANGTALFQWWPEPLAEAFWRHMAERGIWIRLFKHGVRLGLPPDEAAWLRLTQALNEWTR